MDPQRAIGLLRERIQETGDLEPEAWGNVEFERWYYRTVATLKRIFGDDHRFVSDFTDIQFGGQYMGQTLAESVEKDLRSGTAVLEAALYDLEELAAAPSFADAAGIDPELWEDVHRLVEQEDWAKVASQTCIFVESHIRQWAGRPEGEVGVTLATAVFNPKGGVFPLGRTDGEQDGWHQFARGFFGAIRNVDTHRIQVRSDAKRYALGVLGAGSLLLTQLRFEHGNRFRDAKANSYEKVPPSSSPPP